MKQFTYTNTLPLAAAALIFATFGCERNGVKVYRDDSSNAVVTLPPPTAQGAMPASMPDGLAAPDNSSLPKLKYTLPDGWKEKALTQLRVASFEISGNGKTLDLSVIPLGGMAGGDTANVNRWRGQVGQPPQTEDELRKLAEAVEIAGQPGALYDIAGTSPGSGDAVRILGAILYADDTAWYFKMMGDAELAAKQKPALVAFLKSVEFQKLDAPSTMDMSQLPASHPAIPGMTAGGQAAPAADAGAKPTWAVPAGWKEGELAQFLVARFVIQGSGDAAAAVNVSQLNGDGGGLMPNINRWRGQLGQTPLTADELAKLPTIDAAGVKATLTDFAGTDPRSGKPARLIGVVLPANGQTWFYNFMGDPDVVAQQKDALIQFVQSAKHPAAK